MTFPAVIAVSIAAAAPTPAPAQSSSFGVAIVIVLVFALIAAAWSSWLRPLNLALGLGTTVAMWVLSYVALLQPGWAASELLFAAVVLCLVAGGFLAARVGRGQSSGVKVGLISATFNLIVVSAFLVDRQSSSGLVAGAPLYVAGLFAASALLGWVGERLGGAGAGARSPQPSAADQPVNAVVVLCAVTAFSIFAMIVLGGLVTSMEAGLAVPDWPNTFGHNMLLYPISEMKGGVFYEHSHRLFGMLVGAAVLSTWAAVFKTQTRFLPRALVSALLLLVLTQGILGGLRVTGNATMSSDPAMLQPSTRDGIVHGMLGQLVFALAAVLPLTVTARWATAVPVAASRAVRVLPTLALVLLCVQLFLGVALRHLQVPPTDTAGALLPRWARDGHVTMAVIVAVIAIMAGFRCGQLNELPWLKRTGKAAMHTVGLQVLLGLLALAAVLVRRGAAVPWWEAGAATAHQAVGALLLALTAMMTAQALRFVTRPGSGALLSATAAQA